MPQSKLAGWKAKTAQGEVTLPSGTKVRIEIPDLSEMLRAGTVPNELIKFAADTQEAIKGIEELDMERIVEATDFMRWLISATVKDPELVPSDVPELPALDRDMILEFAMRQRDVDAVGHHIYGLEKLADWKRFRSRGAID
jgi:hypothetical protein